MKHKSSWAAAAVGVAALTGVVAHSMQAESENPTPVNSLICNSKDEGKLRLMDSGVTLTNCRPAPYSYSEAVIGRTLEAIFAQPAARGADALKAALKATNG